MRIYLLGIAHLVMGNHFRCWRSTKRWNSSETLLVKKAKSYLIFVLCKILDSDPVSVM